MGKQEQNREKSIIVTCEAATTIAMDELADFQGDIKTISEDNLERLKRRIIKHGINAPVFVWRTKAKKPTNYILDGHQRLAALGSLYDDGWAIPDVPVAFIDAKNRKDAKEKLLGITSQYGEFNMESLIDFTSDLDIEDIRLTGSEFAIVFQPEETNGDNVIPEDVPKLVSQGELWMLNGHRLYCGDSTHDQDVEKACGGETPILMVTDPPYGVNYDPAWRSREAEKGHLAYAGRRVGKVENDDKAMWEDAWALFQGDVAYTWSPAGSLVLTTGATLVDSGFDLRSMIIWSKPHFPIGRGHYHWRHEPCWYAVRKGSTAHWVGDRKQSTIWEIPLDKNTVGGHSTQKPVECMERPIRNHDSEYVYDPFVGSGTTVIAAERAGRKCIAIEINPEYCDVVIERYRLWCEANEVEAAIERM